MSRGELLFIATIPPGFSGKFVMKDFSVVGGLWAFFGGIFAAALHSPSNWGG